jgi:ABC-type glutathione transport system ATPase component
VPLLEASSLCKRFSKDGPDVLSDIDLVLEEGESVAIVGESGSGKTTLARILLGLETPSAGEVRVDGKRLPTSGAEWRRSRRDLQMIPQHATGALDPRMTIRGHFTEVIRAQRLTKAKDGEELIRARLREVRLDDDCLDRYPRRLSGGQQQRAVIARSLLVEPRVLICDEPTSALDPLTQEQIIALLAARCVSPSRLFAVITHDLRVARRLCSRILVMQRGVIVEAGEARAVFDSPSHPYTQELLAATRVHHEGENEPARTE